MSFTYSVVIPTSGNWQQLSNCLDSVVKTSDMSKTEIIVVDNASTDDTPQVCLAYKQALGDAFTYLPQGSNLGFCEATNIGVKASTGAYVVWLNDDTITVPAWLEELRNSIDTPHIYHSKIGIAGPLTNNAGGKQRLKEFANAQPKDLQAAYNHVQGIKDIYRMKDSTGTFVGCEPLEGFLSGFCLMIKREVINAIGGIDERFSPGGFCDNDYILRAINAGYGCVLSHRTFIYHYGSQTLDKLHPEMGRGVRNWAKYVNKYKTDKTNSLLMIQRLKIDNKTQFDTFDRCARINAPLVDGVLFLSDKSEYPEFNEQYVRSIFGSKVAGFLSNAKTAPLDEIRDRLALMRVAHTINFDWVINIDHDEALPKHTTRERLQQLMNPFDPKINGYMFYFNNYWRGSSMARIDGPWGSGFFSRMWRNKKFEVSLRPKTGPNDVGLHCGNRPMSIPESMFVLCDLVIDHYGYEHYEESVRKSEHYRSVDTATGARQEYQTGSENYSHILDESHLQMVVPKPFSLSINLMVKDEETSIGQQLLYYSSIAKEFVICDTGSTDKTKEYLDLVGMPYFEMPMQDNFSAPRNEMIKRSTGTHIMHVDADEQPEEAYLHKILAMLNVGPDIALAHMRTQHKDGRYQVIKQPRIFRNIPEHYYYGRIHETLDNALENRKGFSTQDLNLNIFNPGFLASPETINRKLEFYGRLLELEVQDHPTNSKAQFELGLHYRNWGRIAEAKEILNKALETRPTLVRARLELILIEVNEALVELKKCSGMQTDKEILDVLQQLHSNLSPWEFKPVSV